MACAVCAPPPAAALGVALPTTLPPAGASVAARAAAPLPWARLMAAFARLADDSHGEVSSGGVARGVAPASECDIAEMIDTSYVLVLNEVARSRAAASLVFEWLTLRDATQNKTL